MSSSFTMVLAKKVSNEVLEIGGPVRDFLRAKVAYKPEDPLKPLVEAKIKNTEVMSFEVKYENVPFFCFICGRMGHSERECPEQEDDFEDEEDMVDEPRKRKFGDWLRKSPLKKGEERKLTIPAAPSRVNRALNFSGAQLSKVKGAVSASSKNGAKRKIRDGGLAQSQQSGKSGAGSKKLQPEVSNALSNRMKRVSVQEDAHVPIRVSRLDSFAEFSEQSASDARQGKGEEVAEPRSLLDRLQAAKLAQFKLSTNRTSGFNGPSLSREISKHKNKVELEVWSGLGEQMHMA
jgi:hypothetical protein